MTNVVIPHTKYEADICHIGADRNESRQVSASNGPVISDDSLPALFGGGSGSPSGESPLSDGLRWKKRIPVGIAKSIINPRPNQAVR